MTASLRPTVATVDLDAIRHNCATLRAKVPESTRLLAVVKADAYGHGALPVARACLDAGAAWLGVALVEEGLHLRAGGIEAPVLLLGELTDAGAEAAVEGNLTPSLWSHQALRTAERAASQAGRRVDVHVTVDTGMHREGATPLDAVDIAARVAGSDALHLAGLWTHLAVADEEDRPETGHQLALFSEVVDTLASRGIRPDLLHAANSAALLTRPDSHLDMVRAGITIYGAAPAPSLAACASLRPAMRVTSRVVAVHELRAGEAVSYGLTWSAEEAGRVAVVPIGYADGFARLLSSAGEVLIAGRRRAVAGRVTMDHVIVDCGLDLVAPGDEVVLLGDGITADEIAQRIGTISYEVFCSVSARVPRVYVG